MTDRESSVFGKDEKRLFFFLLLIEIENCMIVVADSRNCREAVCYAQPQWEGDDGLRKASVLNTDSFELKVKMNAGGCFKHSITFFLLWGSSLLSGVVGCDWCRAGVHEAREWEGSAGSQTKAEPWFTEAQLWE